jgi:hypothetical protein
VPPAAASTEVVSNLEPIELSWLFQETVRLVVCNRAHEQLCFCMKYSHASHAFGAVFISELLVAVALIYIPQIRDLLAERSAMGDVQTCVAITEVLKTVTQPVVVAAASASAGATHTNGMPSGVLGAIDGPVAAAADANNDSCHSSGGNSGSGNSGDAGNNSSSSIQRLVDAVSSPGQRREWGW